MSWWWPFKKKLRKVTNHHLHHTELAAHFFMMLPYQQKEVLYYLGIGYDNHAPILDRMEPFRDVQQVLDSTDYFARPMTPEDFMDKLKVLDLTNRRISIVAVLQNIFPDLSSARAHAESVVKWPVELK